MIAIATTCSLMARKHSTLPIIAIAESLKRQHVPLDMIG